MLWQKKGAAKLNTMSSVFDVKFCVCLRTSFAIIARVALCSRPAATHPFTMRKADGEIYFEDGEIYFEESRCYSMNSKFNKT